MVRPGGGEAFYNSMNFSSQSLSGAVTLIGASHLFFVFRWDRRARGGWSWAFPFPCVLESGESLVGWVLVKLFPLRAGIGKNRVLWLYFNVVTFPSALLQQEKIFLSSPWDPCGSSEEKTNEKVMSPQGCAPRCFYLLVTLKSPAISHSHLPVSFPTSCWLG